jgi:hypothetical protein
MNNIDLQRIKDAANDPQTFFYLLPGYKWKRSGNGYRALAASPVFPFIKRTVFGKPPHLMAILKNMIFLV